MSEKQSDEHIIPIVAVGEYDSATRDKGLSSAGVENNSKKLSVFEKMGQVAAKAVHVIREAYAAERIDVDAKRPENDEGVMERLGFPGNTENQTGASEGSTDTSKPSAKPEAKEGKVNTPQVEQASSAKPEAKEGKVNTPQVEQASSAKPEAKEGKVNTPDKSVDTSGDKPNYYSLDDLIYNKDIPKSKADEILKNAYGTAHEPKTLDELIDNPNISKEEADEILDRVYGSSSEKNDREDDVNSAKSDQESGAAESSKDEQVKDSNSDTGEAPVKEISPEEHELATNLKVARMRYVKASVKYETRFFKENFGGEERRKKLDTAAKELERCELEYMRFQFSEKIEAVKQGSEEDQAKLAEEIAHAVFEDMQRVSREIKEAYSEKLDSQSPIRKVLSKLGKWINKGGKISQTVKQGGAGLVGGAIVGSVATWPITTAVGLAAGVGVANLAKLGVLEDRRDKDVLSEIPIERLRKLFRDDVKGMDVGGVIDHTVGGSIGELHNASVERQDDLRKRMRWAMGRFSIGFALGGYAGKFVGDWANSAHATGDSASQSGGKELKTHLLEKVKDTAPGSADPVGNYTPGLDSLYGYDPSKHEFLWQWAESVYGEGNGTSGIMHTVDVLRNNGYIVDIINNPNGSFSVVVDGVSDTEGLVKIFSQFVN